MSIMGNLFSGCSGDEKEKFLKSLDEKLRNFKEETVQHIDNAHDSSSWTASYAGGISSPASATNFYPDISEAYSTGVSIDFYALMGVSTNDLPAFITERIVGTLARDLGAWIIRLALASPDRRGFDIELSGEIADSGRRLCGYPRHDFSVSLNITIQVKSMALRVPIGVYGMSAKPESVYIQLFDMLAHLVENSTPYGDRAELLRRSSLIRKIGASLTANPHSNGINVPVTKPTGTPKIRVIKPRKPNEAKTTEGQESKPAHDVQTVEGADLPAEKDDLPGASPAQT